MSDPRRMMLGAATAAAVERWALPEMDGPVANRRREKQIEEIEAEARLVGHEQGYAAGMATAQAEIAAHTKRLEAEIARLDGMMQTLARPFAELDAAVERELIQLTLAMGRQLVRRELRIDPSQIIAIIREAVTRLPIAARDVRVQLHPEDAAIVREKLAAPAGTGERAWTIVEDPTMSRGGCLVRTETSQIDARLESRLAAVIGSVLGEERSAERVVPAAPDDSKLA